MRTRASIATDPTACLLSPDSDVGADHLHVPPDGRDEVPPRPGKLVEYSAQAPPDFAQIAPSCGTSGRVVQVIMIL
jgi:hypothetical protein